MNQQFGFESEKRKSERHQHFLEIQKWDYEMKRVQAVLAEHRAATQIEADYKAKQAQQAA
jgi:hypothetical protein